MIGKGIEDKTEKSLSRHHINHGCVDSFTTVCSAGPLQSVTEVEKVPHGKIKIQRC